MNPRLLFSAAVAAGLCAGPIALVPPALAAEIEGLPKAGAPHPLQITPAQEKTLANGLRVIVQERPALPLLTAELSIKSGAETDPAKLAGLAHFTANLLKRGTTTRSAPQIAQDTEALGAKIESEASWDVTSVKLTTLSANAEPALAIVSDLVRHPAFAKDEIERQRREMLDDLRLSLEEPGTVARLATRSATLGMSPYAHADTGTPLSLAHFTRKNIVDLHAKAYRPSNAILILTGSLKAEEAFALAEKTFGDWKVPIFPEFAVQARKVPPQIVPLFEQAEDASERGDYETAEKCYRGIVEQVPNNSYALQNLGLTLLAAKKFAQAEEIFKKAIATNPGDLFSISWLGVAYVREGKLDEAAHEWTRVTPLIPKRAAAKPPAGGPRTVPSPEGGEPPRETRVILIDMPTAGQAAVYLATPCIPRTADDWFAGKVTNALLGGGYSSRLNQEVRLKRGLSYGAASGLSTYRGAGLFSAGAQTKNESAAEVVKVMRGEIQRLLTEQAPEEYLKGREAVLTGAFARDLETNDNYSDRLADLALYDLSLDSLSHYIEKVEQVTPADLQTFAQHHFAADRFTIVVAGQAKVIEKPLRELYPKLELIHAGKLDLDSSTLQAPAVPPMALRSAAPPARQ